MTQWYLFGRTFSTGVLVPPRALTAQLRSGPTGRGRPPHGCVAGGHADPRNTIYVLCFQSVVLAFALLITEPDVTSNWHPMSVPDRYGGHLRTVVPGRYDGPLHRYSTRPGAFQCGFFDRLDHLHPH